jgi:hypothetical protein
MLFLIKLCQNINEYMLGSLNVLKIIKHRDIKNDADFLNIE